MRILKRATLALCAVTITLGSSSNDSHTLRPAARNATASADAVSPLRPLPAQADHSVDSWSMLAMGVGLIALQLRRRQRELRRLRLAG